MYLLINAKNDDSLNCMIRILFENGYSTFRMGESIENLCTSCGPTSRNGRKSDEVVLVLEIGEGLAINNAIHILFENGYMSFVVAKSVENACTNCKSSQSRVEVPTLDDTPTEIFHEFENQADMTAEPSCSIKSELDASEDGCISDEVDKLSPYTLILSSLLNQNAPSNDVKKHDESSEMTTPNKSNLSVGTENLDTTPSIFEQLIALRTTLFPQENTKKARSKPRKRQHTAKPGEKVDVHECQLCGTKVTFGSDVRNFLKCADRHARLHATRKQYSCVECGVGFTRIDVVKQHIASHHKGSEVKFIDHGFELRDEYLALSEQCFPKTEAIRKSLKKVSL